MLDDDIPNAECTKNNTTQHINAEITYIFSKNIQDSLYIKSSKTIDTNKDPQQHENII